MSYNCILFKNTGFNAVNIPDSPALLNTVGSPLSVPALEIVQDRWLDSIKVHATYSQVMDVDYAKVGDFFYMVEGMHMLNGDTAELYLLPDFITSAGGVGNLTFIDGLTERVHVTNDTYGKYPEYDELMAPAEPLEIVGELYGPAIGSECNFVEATYDLYKAGEKDQNGNFVYDTGMTYTDTTTGDMVTAPCNPPLTSVTNFKLKTYSGTQATHDNQTAVFDYNSQQVKDGIQRGRDLGTEGGIIAQWRVPRLYLDINDTMKQNYMYTDIAGCDPSYGTLPAIAAPFEYAQVKNLKVMYSPITKFGLMTMAGDKAEFAPADIYQSGAVQPDVIVCSDPRPDGKPYFRYKNYLGDNGANFYKNCIAGVIWENLPLVYQGKSGTAITRLQFEADRKEAWGQFKGGAIGSIAGSAVSGAMRGASILGVGGAAAGSAIPGAGTLAGAGIGAAIGAVGGAAVAGIGAISDYLDYKRRGQAELQKFVTSNLVTAPEIQIPYTPEYLRDTYGNDVFAYRYKYSQNDIARIDKILTMYGYKHIKAIEQTDFTNRQDFNYIEARGVQVTGNANKLPRWWCEGIAAQLEGGTRIWHVAPDPTLYN